jgi:hypothetical protein
MMVAKELSEARPVASWFRQMFSSLGSGTPFPPEPSKGFSNADHAHALATRLQEQQTAAASPLQHLEPDINFQAFAPWEDLNALSYDSAPLDNAFFSELSWDVQDTTWMLDLEARLPGGPA